MKQLKRRILVTAERLQAQPVCRTCLGWGPVTFCDDAGWCLRPEVCPECGRWVPVRQRGMVIGVGLERL